MSARERTDGAVGAWGWGVSLAAALVACAVAAWVAVSPGGEWGLFVATIAIGAGYLLLFQLVLRRIPADTPGVWVVAVVTILVAGGMTALVPSNAALQFWAFPALWALQSRLVPTLALTAALTVAVFLGFAVSTGDQPGWQVTALLTQGISYAFNIVMGLWLRQVYLVSEARERLLAELTAAQDQLATLHREAGTAAERERISRELHDTIAQSLAGVVLLVQRARREFAGGTLTDDTLQITEDAARAALTETRTLVAGSAPVELHSGGLASALNTLADRFRRETGLEVAVEADSGVDDVLDRERDVGLLRCAQEALANVRKHSGAQRVRIALRQDDAGAVLEVGNDGRGFDPHSAPVGYGLPGLRDRLALVGGALEVDGTDGAVRLRARVPRGGDA